MVLNLEFAEIVARSLPDPVLIFDQNLVIQQINTRGTETIHRHLEDGTYEIVGKSLSLLYGSPVSPVEDFLRRVIQNGRPDTVSEFRLLLDSKGRSRSVYLEVVGIPIQGGVLAIVRDRTEYRVLVEQLRRERDFSKLVLNRTGALVVVLDPEGRIVEFNETCRRLTGYTLDEVRGRRVWDFLIVPEEVEGVRRVFEELCTGHFPNQFENFWVTKEGRKYRIAWTNSAILDRSGAVAWVVGTGWDVTETRAREERLRHDALHDPLTGLANRTFLMELLRFAAHRAEREPGHRFGVVYLDLDDFKEVNDRHGHSFGDRVLKAVGERLRRVVRKSDTVARVGGDEFVILADPIQDNEGFTRLADRLLASAREPIDVNGTRIQISASLGLVLCGRDDRDPEVVIARADEAMYRAKRARKGRSSFTRHNP